MPALDEEQATQRRARVLGMDYCRYLADRRTSRCTKRLLTVHELYDLKVIPLQSYDSNLLFGVTTTTSQQTMSIWRKRFTDQRVSFAIISDTGYRDYMKLYDPPKQVVYQDIDINQTGSDQLVEQISGMLEQVRADDMLAYLVAQAHRLNASDIHVETAVSDIRIRLRIDGVLHPVARLQQDKYRMLISAIASAGNVSTSSNEAQQGHIAQKVKMADGNEVDVNVRLETVPTINGMDVVMRLFNMDQSMYTLDKLGLSDSRARSGRRYYRQAERPGDGRRSDRLRQDHHAVLDAQFAEHRRAQNYHHRRPSGVSVRRHYPDLGALHRRRQRRQLRRQTTRRAAPRPGHRDGRRDSRHGYRQNGFAGGADRPPGAGYLPRRFGRCRPDPHRRHYRPKPAVRLGHPPGHGPAPDPSSGRCPKQAYSPSEAEWQQINDVVATLA